MQIYPLIDPYALRADGTVPLTADWAMGAYDITGGVDATFSGTVSGGTLTDGTVSITGGIIAAGDGTVAAPSYTFTSDLDTGIYWPGTGQMGFSMNGADTLALGPIVFNFHSYTNITPLGPTFNFGRARGSYASPQDTTANNLLLNINAQGYVSGFITGAAIKVFADADWAASDYPARISFFTVPDGTATLVERMRIDNAGNTTFYNGQEIRFSDVGNSNYVGFKAPALTANQIWTLPTADGSADEILTTNGSGVLSFARMPKAIYAELSDSGDQTFAVAGTHYSIVFDTNDEIAGITHSTSSNPENITIITTGVYTIFAQPQVAAAAGGAGTFHMWLQNNTGSGFVDIANTNIELSLASAKEDVIPLATTFLLTAGDIIRLRVNVSDNGIKLDAQAAIVGPPTEPVIPSIIFTMFMIGT